MNIGSITSQAPNFPGVMALSSFCCSSEGEPSSTMRMRVENFAVESADIRLRR